LASSVLNQGRASFYLGRSLSNKDSDSL